jgi:hypothetical protein
MLDAMTMHHAFIRRISVVAAGILVALSCWAAVIRNSSGSSLRAPGGPQSTVEWISLNPTAHP